MEIRVGLGYDIHRLVPGRKLYLGGIEIPFSQGLAGHSDGDCLIHAIIDSLLGALGEGDIGQLFPDDDSRYQDIRSTELLKEVMERIFHHEHTILSLDTVIVAEKPRLTPFIPRIKDKLSSLLNLRVKYLGVKAKTNEGIGLIGKEKAIACWAVVLLGKGKGGG